MARTSYITFPTRVNSITGEEEIVEIGLWAKETLSDAEYTLFLSATDRQNAIASQSEISISTIRNPSVNYFKKDINRAIGIDIRTEDSREPDNEWFGFWERYVNDPNLTWIEKP